jgi:hypothetical protein
MSFNGADQTATSTSDETILHGNHETTIRCAARSADQCDAGWSFRH